MIETVVRVGIAEMSIVKSPDKIRTSGLGSCVGIVIYDTKAKLAGLAHIMLPDSSLAIKQLPLNQAKFANTAIKQLIALLELAGSSRLNMRAKIAGGAQMFHYLTQNEQMRIGPRNIEAVKKELLLSQIPLVAEDTGGHNGRTIELCTESFMLEIRTVHQDTIRI